MRYARYMSVSVDEVMQMEYKDFKNKLNLVESLLAEERYILQRQLDNHLYLNSKNTINKYTDIYKEFTEQMRKVNVYSERKLTQDEMKKIHEANLKKLGLRR